MSISIDPKDGVRLKTVRKRGFGVAAVVIALEAIFSLLLYISLAQRVFVITPAGATAGVPELIAYQGMLTDTSGNPLGGAGSVYCFRYSIWDAQSGGDQLWPSPAIGDASTTPSNSTTTVTDGVFSDELGRMDTLAGLDFESTSTYYLQVQVSTSSLTCASGLETLSPRQQITSDAWAQTAQGVYSSQLRTFSSNNTVQIGTGGGVAAGSQTLLSLDVVNTGETIGGSCSTNGTLWYDSNLKRALVCEQGVIVPISQSETVTGNGLSGSSTVVNPVWDAGANISFSTNGSTISILGAAGGGGGATLSHWEDYQFGSNTSVTSVAPASAYFQTINLPSPVAVSNVNLIKSFNFGLPSATSTASSGENNFSYTQGISFFTRVNFGGSSSQISVLTTASAGLTLQYSYTSNSQTLSASWVTNSTGGTASWSSTSNSNNLSSYWTGLKFFPIPLVTTLTAGEYWLGYKMSTTTASTGQNVAILSLSQAGMNFAAGTVGLLSSAGSIASIAPGNQGIGSVATANVVTNNTMALSVISQVSSTAQYVQYINFADM